MSRSASFLVCLLGACAGGGAEDAASKLPEDSATVSTTCASATYDTAPGAWALPSAPADGTFTRAERPAADCGAGLPATRLRDLTGDGRPDLVALTDCDDAEVGRTRWRVWPGADGGFGDEIAWALPRGFDAGAFADLSRADADCASTDDHPAFLLADLDGDGAEDLVVTHACSDPTGGGVWRVHRNTGAGFAAEAVERVPEGGAYTPGAFVAPRDTPTCTTALHLPAWDLLDLDGDGPADLVVTASCTGGTLGWDHWEVQRGGAEAFAAAATWPVPTAAGATSVASDRSNCPSSPAHFVADLDGDARPEMIAPVACNASGSDWTVWRNAGDGFAALPDTPAGPLYLNYYVDGPERTAVDCAAGERAWTLADADADGWADLTLTGVCEDPAIGDTRWDHWRGSRDGWIEHVPLALPTGYSPGSFSGAGSDAHGCGGTANRPAWTRADLDADGVPEIVVTEACDDPDVGVTHWRVYARACAG